MHSVHIEMAPLTAEQIRVLVCSLTPVEFGTRRQVFEPVALYMSVLPEELDVEFVRVMEAMQPPRWEQRHNTNRFSMHRMSCTVEARLIKNEYDFDPAF